MPTTNEVLDAIHGALIEFRMEIPSLNSIDTTQSTSPNLSCVNFAGAILERINKNPEKWPSSQYIYPSGLFINITIIGEPSEYNHGFCVYFHNHTAYVIQAFLGHRVRLITPLSIDIFVTSLAKLRNKDPSDVYSGYKAISSVDISNSNYTVHDLYIYKA